MLAGKQSESDDVYSEPYTLAPARVQTSTEPPSTSGSLDSQPKRNSQTRKAYRSKGTKDRTGTGEKSYYSESQCLHDDMGHSYSEPVGIYSPGSGSMTAGVFTPVNSELPDRDNVTHDHEAISYELAKSSEEVLPRQQIHLGDYTEPPDRKKDSVGGIRRPKPEEYSDPYDVEKLLAARSDQKKTTQKLRHSAPAKGSQDDLYELAQPVQDTGSSPSKGNNSSVNTKKVPLHRTQSEVVTYDHVPNIAGTSFDSGVETGAETGCEIQESELEEQDDYDHLSTWKGESNPSSPRKSADYTKSQTLVVGQKPDSSKMNTVSSAYSPGGAAMAASPKQPAGRVEELYAGAYEEPWDSKRSQQQFSNIVGKAESKYPDSNDDSIIPGVVLRPKKQKPFEAAVYEDAWDTEEKQKQFEDKVKEAQRKQSGGAVQPQKSNDNASAATYDEPWTDCLRKSHPPKSLPGQPKVRVSSSNPTQRPSQALPPMNNPAHRPPQNLPGSSSASDSMEAESNTYESPWDTKKKEQEFEDKVSRLKHGSPVNQRTVVDTPPLSPGSPPNFYPPPPPTSQMYEEAWDTKRPSHLLAKAQPEVPRSSQSQNRMSDGLGRERAEPIDSGLPLDIQKFYHGGITRKEAEELMRIHKEGSYLVRRSETQKNVFSLSIKGIRGMPMHIRIGLSQGEYILGENSQPFPTVPEVIDYYTRHELPVQNAGRLRLLYPIMRNKHAN